MADHGHKIGETVKIRSLDGEVMTAKITAQTRRNSKEQEPTYSVEGTHSNGSKVRHNHVMEEELR